MRCVPFTFSDFSCTSNALTTQEWIDTFCTTRLIAPLGLGQSGFKPRRNEKKRPSNCPNMTYKGGHVLGLALQLRICRGAHRYPHFD
jgi:hypothetical protein